MTIDERIEALTMHLEVLTHVHQDFEKKMTEYAAETKESMGRLEQNMERLTTTMERLAHIVIAHEERIERLEDGK